MEQESISERKIQRVLSVSLINGWSVAGFAGLCSLGILLMGDGLGFLVGLLVAISGGLELRGNALLKAKVLTSFRWLVGSQLYLIVVLWSYAIWQLVRFDSQNVWALFSDEFKELILKVNPDVYLVEALIRITYPATYCALVVTVLIYQGGLCLYYRSRKKYLYLVR